MKILVRWNIGVRVGGERSETTLSTRQSVPHFYICFSAHPHSKPLVFGTKSTLLRESFELLWFSDAKGAQALNIALDKLPPIRNYPTE